MLSLMLVHPSSWMEHGTSMVSLLNTFSLRWAASKATVYQPLFIDGGVHTLHDFSEALFPEGVEWDIAL